MEYTTENTYLQIVRLIDDRETGSLGAALKRSLGILVFDYIVTFIILIVIHARWWALSDSDTSKKADEKQNY